MQRSENEILHFFILKYIRKNFQVLLASENSSVMLITKKNVANQWE